MRRPVRPRAPQPRPASAPPIRAVTSDLWYTLLYLRPRDQARQEARRRALWSAPLLRHGLSAERAARLVLRMEAHCHGMEARGESFPIERQAEWLAALSGVPLRAEELVPKLDRLLARTPVRVAPQALEVLDAWRAEGIRVGLVSNVVFESAGGTRALLERSGLLTRLDAVYLSVEHPWGKPDPRPFRICLRQLGVPPVRAVHIGDRPWDVRGALRAGLRALRFRRYPLRSDRRDFVNGKDGRRGVRDVHDWDEVASAVARLRRT